MRNFIKTNTVEFFLVGFMIYCWIMGVVEGMGFGITYVIYNMREKVIIKKRLEQTGVDKE